MHRLFGRFDRLEALRRSFWLLPAIAMVLSVALGLTLPFLDEATDVEIFLIELARLDNARSLLATIATVTVSVAGIAFSVTVVALQLASQQLSPRVLRTFQNDRLAQSVLAVFVGTFAYCLLVLTSVGESGPRGVPNLSLALAIVLAVIAFALFIAFIHDIVISLQASTLIRRIAADGHAAIEERFPDGVGHSPDDEEAARRRIEERTSSPGAAIRAQRAGYLRSIDTDAVMDAAKEHDALVVQRLPVGDFVLTGALLAEVWCSEPEDADGLAGAVHDAFRIGDERTIVQDPAFPIRQLADVALRGLSPSLNDPTTAENAMNTLADTILRFARTGPRSPIRVDDEGEPRFVAAAVELDQLVRLGFDQVRVAAAEHQVVGVRLLELLEAIEVEAAEAGASCAELRRQAELLRTGAAGDVPSEEDARRVREAPGPDTGEVPARAAGP